MDKETLRNMDQKTYQKMLEDAAFDEINTMLNISKGHSQELHENITNEDLIKRIITEEKLNISSFWDNESLKDGVSNVIAYRSQAITKWLFKERYEFDNPKDYQKLCISADIGGDSVGHGFNNSDGVVKEKETSAVTVVLQRDMDGESPFGFYIKTAYADIQHENAILTGLQYTKEDIINNPNITFDSAIQKLYFAISDKYKDVKIYQRTNPDTKEPYIKLIFPERENGRIEAFVTNDDTSIKHIASDEMRKINFSECFFHYEEESKVISDVQNIQNIIREKAKENIKESIKETDIACQKAHKGDEAR